MTANSPPDLPPRGRLARIFLGRRKDIRDPGIFHRMALIPFLAWVGLGADGLSSSAYGPEEAFKTLGAHTYLALALAVATAFTVLVISYAYSRIIEQFPLGGGGYVVASRLLGQRAGAHGGCTRHIRMSGLERPRWWRISPAGVSQHEQPAGPGRNHSWLRSIPSGTLQQLDSGDTIHGHLRAGTLLLQHTRR